MDIDKIVNSMTLEEKAALLTGKDFWQTQDYEKYGIKSMFLSDGPHGLRKQAAEADHLGLNPSVPSTCFPTAAAMANSWNEELGEQLGKALGEEAASMGVNVILGPGICIKRNPRCGRNFEYFSEDPYLAGKMAAAYIRGIQKNGTSACVKHFAMNNQELQRMTTDSIADERTLREIYLTAFEIAVKEGKSKAIMSSYNKINGVYADENKKLITDILRGEWGFDGAVISDWAGTNNKVESVKAGSDLEMPACKYGADDVVKAVKDGSLDISAVDECVKRVIRLSEETSKAERGEKFDVEAHHALAKKCAEESVVLLKNDKVLPIKGQSVAFIGDFFFTPRYQGAGSSIVNPTKLDGYEEAFKAAGINSIGFARGFDRFEKKNDKLTEQAEELAKKADVVIMAVGLNEVGEAEGIDREHIMLPDNQKELYETLRKICRRIVLVLFCGSTVELGWGSSADAIVYASLMGQAGAGALADILAGKVNPSGKLAETFVSLYDLCPSAHYFHKSGANVEYRESIFVGYRYYDTAAVPVAYPFGYGLSYTSFKYSDVSADEKGVKFSITNVGSFDGAETAQLYIGKKDSVIFRPKKELKGFKKVFLKVGETKEVYIPFDDKTFRFFNAASDKWEIEGGEYEIYVGASSADIRLSAMTSVEGNMTKAPYDRKKLPSYYAAKIGDIKDGEFAALLGRQIPSAEYAFYKKNRMVIHENCTVSELRYSKRWVGRFFSWCIRFAIKFLRGTGRRSDANTLVMGVLYQPIRGMAKFGGMTRRQMEGMLNMFNGHLFKGLGMMISKEKK